MELKNKAILNLKQYCIHCYVALVTYSNHFKIYRIVAIINKAFNLMI